MTLSWKSDCYARRVISRYVEHEYLDAGITGRDWVAENQSDVQELAELSFSKASARPTR